MTEPGRPDDRELEQYLKGDSTLSRRYREASGESPPPALDEAILAQARGELRRRPHGINRWLAPVALAASVMLGINLGWNVYQATPRPGEAPQLKDAAAPAPQAIAPAAPPVALETAPESKAKQSFVPEPPAERDVAAARGAEGMQRSVAEAESARRAEDEDRRKEELEQRQQAYAMEQPRTLEKQAAMPQRRDALAGASADSAAPSVAAAPAPLTEAQKIDRLIAYVAGLDGVAFIRNGDEHTPADAAKHMRLKREKAGKRVQTADDFIRLCASFSTTTGEAYLIRFPDGRTRTAEDVLREQLAAMP